MMRDAQWYAVATGERSSEGIVTDTAGWRAAPEAHSWNPDHSPEEARDDAQNLRQMARPYARVSLPQVEQSISHRWPLSTAYDEIVLFFTKFWAGR
jgi:predicted NAD/FAD-dependent oxidoreductase